MKDNFEDELENKIKILSVYYSRFYNEVLCIVKEKDLRKCLKIDKTILSCDYI